MSYSDVARRRESDRERAKRYRGRKGVTEGVTESGDSGSKGVTRGVKGVTILEGVTRGVTVIDLVKDLGLDLGKDLGLTGWNAEGGLNGQEEGWKEEGLQVRGDYERFRN